MDKIRRWRQRISQLCRIRGRLENQLMTPKAMRIGSVVKQYYSVLMAKTLPAMADFASKVFCRVGARTYEEDTPRSCAISLDKRSLFSYLQLILKQVLITGDTGCLAKREVEIKALFSDNFERMMLLE